jgi:hypothetical protein
VTGGDGPAQKFLYVSLTKGTFSADPSPPVTRHLGGEDRVAMRSGKTTRGGCSLAGPVRLLDALTGPTRAAHGRVLYERNSASEQARPNGDGQQMDLTQRAAVTGVWVSGADREDDR